MTESERGRVVTFYSYKGGVGRTMAMANVAWIIASNGKRVLAVDWDLESPGLHDFFHPFLAESIVNGESVVDATPGIIEIFDEFVSTASKPAPPDSDLYARCADIQRHAVSLNWEFPEGGTLDFLSAGRQDQEYSSAVCSLDWDDFYDRLNGENFLRALRREMRRNYDYVLIDSRPGLSNAADVCTIEFPDVLTLCFTLSGQSIKGAANVARQISGRYGARQIRILPVPMRIDPLGHDRAKLRHGREFARKRFAGFPAGLEETASIEYWDSVEVPYIPTYSYEEILATFGDEPGKPMSLLSAYERITRWVTDGEVESMRPMSEDLRSRYLSAFGRQAGLSKGVYLSYVAEDFYSALCIQTALSRAGFHVVWRAVDGDSKDGDVGEQTDGDLNNFFRAIVVVSKNYLESAGGMRIWERLAAAPGMRLVPVRVEDLSLPQALATGSAVDLTELAPDTAAKKLIRDLQTLQF